MNREIFLGKYEAKHLLGEGGMGRVFLGNDLSSGREVVIKVMHDHIAANSRFRQNFQREMILMTRFRHPFAVELYEACIDSARPCIVMEFIRGETLDGLVRRQGRLQVNRVGVLLGQLCQVLQAAHDAGIVHRDLTPVNIMVTNPGSANESVKVMDFGLARMGDAPYIPLEKLTGQPSSIGGGTPDYVSPEQVRGEEVDHRADIYSLGVLLFKVLTGYLPFEKATSAADILLAQVETAPPSFAAVGARGIAPAAVEEVVQACLAKYPNERPQTALELGQRFEKALGRKILPSHPIPATILPLPREERHYDPRAVMDTIEAWMPEAIAVVKLRGFAQDVGGEIVESEPGFIRVRLLDPTTPPNKSPKSWLALLGFGLKPRSLEHATLELHLEKKTAGQKNLLLITAALQPEENPRRSSDPDWRSWAEQVCLDLRAYLIGR